jgi:hypothetical protein
MPVNVNFNTRTLIGKVKARSQMCGIYTEDGRKVITELSVLKGCISDDSKLSGWLVDADELVQDEQTGLWIQLLDERSIMPVPAITGKAKAKDLKKLVNEIFKDSISVDLVTMNEEARKDKQRTWLMLILGTPIVLAALILGIKVING